MPDKNDKDGDNKAKSPTGKFPRVRGGDLGEILLRSQVISIEQLDTARSQLAERGGSLSQRLGEIGVSEDAIVKQLSLTFNVPSVDLTGVNVPDEVLKLIPRRLALRHGIIPLELKDGVLTYATADPSNLHVMDDLKMMPGFKRAEIVVTGDSALKKALDEFYKEDTLDDVLDGLTEEEVRIVQGEKEIDSNTLKQESEDINIVRLVNVIFLKAVKEGASDIHFEVSETDFTIRYRIDGILHEAMKPSYQFRDAVISRIKILSNLKIDERRLPQDGRIKLKAGSKEVDFRVSILPVLFGEDAVLRVLDKSALQLDMTRLGLDAEQLAEFKQAVHAPWGMVLVTGPTGSGKTTTLYSALMDLNKPDVKVLTAEDPVEITVKGVSQVEIKDEIGRSFGTVLRSFLRQDPDIIMIGEIRDFETAEIAVKAAQTGHLVLSTLHTNDAPSTLNRLLNMGVEPFLVTAAVNLIVAQRLVRVICKNCKEEHIVPAKTLIDNGMASGEEVDVKLYRGHGCNRCNGTGYKGRLALFEVLPMSDEIKECVLSGLTANEIQREAMRLGMQTLRQSGVKKVLEGVTTVEEVLRVTK